MAFGEERREFQRVRFPRPLAGHFGDVPIHVIDLSVIGLLIEHSVPVPPEGDVAFQWGGDRIELQCTVAYTDEVHARDGGTLLRSGLKITSTHAPVARTLRQKIFDYLEQVFAAQQANALGQRDGNRFDGDATITSIGAASRSKTVGFLTFHWKNGAWRKVKALLPDQPADGFTVAAYEDPEECERLCKAWEEADEEGRKLIRMMAELTISEALHRPPVEEVD